ncbi:hypothetical protein HGRIS_007209 [Hohenbuehelia grisea]|uniref:Alpha-type protein kinase domain-containing protein n=1 Tax=Hohenbuehelia grisea TaxID=104357 RepID=A0ABR3JBI8_9AGAR
MEKRMGQKPAAPPGPVTPQAELAALRSNTGKVGSFSIFYEVRKSNAAGSIDKTLGKSCTPHPENITMLELQERIIKEMNPRWTDKHLSNLQLDETELRVQGNVAFPPKDLGLTIRQWYNKYNTPETHEAYVKTPKGMTKGTSFSVELFIDMEKYYERTGELCQGTTFGSEIQNMGRKRKSTMPSAKGGKKKRGDGSGTTTHAPLQSTFCSTEELADLPDVQLATSISFKRTTCTIDPDTGIATLTETEEAEPGLLDVTPLELATQGRTKLVYGLTIKDSQYVAKQLINIGKGPVHGGVEPRVAVKYLTADLIRLTRMRSFAGRFMSEAQSAGAEVAEFRISDGFLIKVYAPSDPEDHSEHFGEPAFAAVLKAAYLVEPRRASTAVFKFSGTLGVSNRIDKKSATIMAFSHFVLQETACQYMFSDIQGTPMTSSKGKDTTIVLFDPMTHTLKGKSGLGDHGLDGIRTFIEQHQCSPICRAISLCDSQALKVTYDALKPGAEGSQTVDTDMESSDDE